jgi:hypothetical protein
MTDVRLLAFLKNYWGFKPLPMKKIAQEALKLKSMTGYMGGSLRELNFSKLNGYGCKTITK